MAMVEAPSRRRLLQALTAFGAGAALPKPATAQGLLRPWPSGHPTPPLELPGYDGPAWSLRSARGSVVVLNFWAAWCEPCRTEMPSLELLAERHKHDGLVVVAVNFQETDAAIRRFMEQTPVSLPIVRDRDGAASRAWGVRVFPTTVLVGRDGAARYSVVGEVDWGGPAARQWIASLL
jgi:thiol-disulfide isomerase/thioredoxin